MRDKLATAFCFFCFFFSGKFSQAKTSSLSLGVDLKTTYMINRDKVLQDYYLFRDFDFYGDKKTFLLDSKKDILKPSWFPMTIGLNLGYGYNFTNKLGFLLNINLNKGSILVAHVDANGYKKNNYSNSKDLQRKISDDNKKGFKIESHGINSDLRIKYDIINSSLDFDDYGRNVWLMSLSLGVKLNILFNKRFLLLDQSIEKVDITKQEETGLKSPTKKKEIKSQDRMNMFFPGAVLGFNIVAPFNLGLGIDFTYYFRNFFNVSQKIQQSDTTFKNSVEGPRNEGYKPTYKELSHYMQLGLHLFYDFAPFVNNHEAPTEIDIEKW